MKNLIERIAGVGFAARYQVSKVEGRIETAIDPHLYTWSLRGRPQDQAESDDSAAFELTTGNGRITIEDLVTPAGAVMEVVCAFRETDTETLRGLYRAQLIGSLGGARALGGEVDPFLFTDRF